MNTVIKITDINGTYTELNGFSYKYGEKIVLDEINKCFVNSLIDILYKNIKYHIEKYLLTNKIKQCNKFNKCSINHKKNVILKMGRKDKDTIIEGQILLGLKDSSFEFLLRYVINNNEGFNINHLELEGFDFVKYFTGLKTINK